MCNATVMITSVPVNLQLLSVVCTQTDNEVHIYMSLQVYVCVCVWSVCVWCDVCGCFMWDVYVCVCGLCVCV